MQSQRSSEKRRHHQASRGGLTSLLFMRQASSELTSEWSEKQQSFLRVRCRAMGYRLVLRESNPLARAWQVIISVFLFYTATVFPYYLCFYHFRSPERDSPYEGKVWILVEWVVDIVFWVDLLLGFIMTFHDDRGQEVAEPGPIVRNYLKGAFWLNLPACIPLAVVEVILKWIVPQLSDDTGTRRTAQLTRLQRISRLARLVRLLRLLKVLPFLFKKAKVRRWRSSREMRILTSLAYQLFFVHLLACGWYLVAFFVKEDTFLERRELPDGRTLLDQPAGVQWAHSMYFVLSVFTTVGFGDIHAVSHGEVVYCCVTMMAGVILNSVIVSEMITILTRIDEAADKVNKLKDHVSAFAEHTGLDEATRQAILRVLDNSRRVHANFDRDQIVQLLQSVILPLPMAEQLPDILHGGKLLSNRFLSILSTKIVKLPPRLVALLACSLTEQQTSSGEFVYRCHEHPVSLFICFEGCYACVAYPTSQGAAVEPAPVVISAGRAFDALSYLRHFQPAMDKTAALSKEAQGEDEFAPARLLNAAFNTVEHAARPMLVNPWKPAESDQVVRMESPGGFSHGSSSPMPSPGIRKRLRKFWLESSGETGSPPLAGASGSVGSPGATFGMSRKGMTMSLSSNCDSQNSLLPTVNGGQPQLHPFKLYSFGTYFGDCELLTDEPRKFSVRCESRHGSLMVLRKGDFFTLIRDYPQYGNMWRTFARRRDAMRHALASGLTYGMRYKQLAAVILQQWWRAMRKVWRHRPPSEKRLSPHASASVSATGSRSINGSREVLKMAEPPFEAVSLQLEKEVNGEDSAHTTSERAGKEELFPPSHTMTAVSSMHTDVSEELQLLRQTLHTIRSSQQALQSKVVLMRTVLSKVEGELRKADLL